MRKTLFGLFAFLAAGSLLLAGCGGGGEMAPAGESTPAPSETASTPTASAPMGSAVISGTVTFTGEVPDLKPIDMSADPTCAAKHDTPVMPDMLLLGDGNTMGNIFVHVTNPPEGNYTAPSEPAVIDQRGCQYHPHVIGVMAGQPLEFKNSDGLLHNVHGLPNENRPFNLGMPATLTESSVTLNRPEPLFHVKCDVHPWMQAYVAVMDNPYFAVTGKDGHFSIEGLPAGTYTVEAWHERLGTKTAEVTVTDGGTATADFSFGTGG